MMVFARGQRGDQADTDFPIESERTDDRLDGAADGAGEALLDGRRVAVMQRQMGHAPEDHADEQDDGAGALRKMSERSSRRWPRDRTVGQR